MFDTLTIITLFLLASLLVCLLFLRLSVNIKHICLFFHSLLVLTDFLKFQPPFILTPLPPLTKFLKNLHTPLPLPPPHPVYGEENVC